MSSIFFGKGSLARTIYDEAYELEKQEPSYAKEKPETLEHAVYSFLQSTLEDAEDDENVPSNLRFLTTAYYRSIINSLSSEVEWRKYVADWVNTQLQNQWEQARMLLAPYIERLEEYIDYGRIAGNELFWIVKDTVWFGAGTKGCYLIKWMTFHPEYTGTEDETDTAFAPLGRSSQVQTFWKLEDALERQKELVEQFA